MRQSKGFWLWGEFSNQSRQNLYLIQKTVQNKLSSPKFNLHITLTGPYMVVDKLFLNSLKTLLKDRKSLLLTTLKYEYTSEFYKSFFISIENSKDLDSLKKDLYLLYPYSSNINSNPHVSLTYGNHSRIEKEKMIAILDKPPKYIFMNRVSIVNVDENNNQWQILKSIKLS